MAERPEPLNPKTFLACFLIGSAGIVLLKWLDMNQFVVTACPVAIMLGYAIRHSKQRAYLNLVGDNLYYLGLLYTLVSLAASLYEFTPKEDDIESITPIITNFGIAIFSTILGVAFRVCFNLKQTDPEEIEERARVELADVVRELNLGLREATHSFLRSSREMQGNLKWGLEETKNAIDENLQQSLSRLDTAIANFVTTVEKADNRFDQNQQKLRQGFEEAQSVIDDAAGVLGESRKKLQEGSDAMAESLNGLVEKIDNISAPEDLLEKILQPLSQRIEAVAEQVGTAGETLTTKLGNIEIPTDKFEQDLQEAIVAFLDKMERSLSSQFENATQKFERDLKAFSGVIQSANEGFETDSQKMRESTNAFVKSMQDLSQRISNIEVSDDLLEKLLNQSVEPFGRTAEQIGTAGDDLVQTLDRVQNAADEFEQVIRKTTDAHPTGRNWKHKIRNFFQPVKPEKERTDTREQHQGDTETVPDSPVKPKKEQDSKDANH